MLTILQILSVLYFVFISWGFGLALLGKHVKEFWERQAMRLAIGLAATPLLLILLHQIGLPISWMTSLILGLAGPAIYFGMNRKIEYNKPSWQTVCAFALFIVFLCVFVFGAFKYDWLEDTDPYGYAISTSFISHTGSFSKPTDIAVSNYLEPDPVGYSIMMSLPFGVNQDMYFTLKFFNVLIISLSVLFFYYFVKRFSGSENKALFASFCLAMIPCFLTHFIFATTLGVLFFFPALYCLERVKEHRWWVILAGLCMSGIFLTHTICSIAFGIFFAVYFLFNFNWRVFTAGALGVALSLPYWIHEMLKYTWEGILKHVGVFEGVTNMAGTADRIYNLQDFLVAPGQNLINTSTGIGIGIIAACIVGLFLIIKNKDNKMWIPAIWAGICLIMVNLAGASFKIMPFRWWTFLSIPLCMIAALILDIKQKGRTAIIIIAIIAIILTAGVPKYIINTSKWPPSPSLMQTQSITDYIWIKNNLPQNSDVFSFYSMGKFQGFNMQSCEWCKDDLAFAQTFLNATPQQMKGYLTDRYDYFIIESFYADKYTAEELNAKAIEIAQSKLFPLIYQTQTMLIFQIPNGGEQR